MDVHDYARKIYDESRRCKVAVFKLSTRGQPLEVKYMEARGGRFEAMFRDFTSNFVGIYDSKCDLSMIKDDLT